MTSMVYMLQPIMIGTIIGFYMIDERDAKIFELLRVTPLGISGYLFNRLFIPIIMNLVYMVIGYLMIGYRIHGILNLLPIGLFLALETVGIGLLIAMISEDKVKGLTNAKAVSAMAVFGFVKLINIEWVVLVGRFTPQFYITEMLSNISFITILQGVAVHIFWLFFLFIKEL